MSLTKELYKGSAAALIGGCLLGPLGSVAAVWATHKMFPPADSYSDQNGNDVIDFAFFSIREDQPQFIVSVKPKDFKAVMKRFLELISADQLHAEVIVGVCKSETEKPDFISFADACQLAGIA